jgi:hypothetical protein
MVIILKMASTIDPYVIANPHVFINDRIIDVAIIPNA